VSGTERIVTEIIIDTSNAVRSTAELAAIQRVAQKAADDYTGRVDRNAAAVKAAAAAGVDAASALGLTSAQYKAAAAAADSYRGRLDPAVAAQLALTKELQLASTALLGLGKQYAQQQVSVKELDQGTVQLKARMVELQGAIDGVKSGSMGATQGMNFLKTSAEQAAETIKPLIAATNDLRLKYDDVYRVTKQYDAAIDGIIAARNAEKISVDLASAAIAKETAIRDANLAAIKKAAATPDKAAEANKLRASIDPLFAAFQKYEAELERIAAVESKVAGMTTVATAARDRAKASYQKEVEGVIGLGKAHEDLGKKMGDAGASASQMKFATQQLTVQMSQMFSGIATGQPIMITLIQQGHQVLDVMWSTGTSVKQLGEQFMTLVNGALKAILTPIGLVVTGVLAVAGAIAYLAVNAETQARSFNALKVALSATRGDYDAVATSIEKDSRRIAASLGLSRDEVTSTMGAIAALPLPAGLNSSLEDLTRTAANLGTVLGTGLAGGLKNVSAALQDPTKAAMAFADTAGGLRTLSGALLRNIIDLQAAGDRVGATNILLASMKAAAKIAEEGLTPLEKAMRDLSVTFEKGSTGGKNFFRDLGDGINSVVVGAVKALDGLVQAINKLYELASKFPSLGAAITGAFGAMPGLGPFVTAGVGVANIYDAFFGQNFTTKSVTPDKAAQIELWRAAPGAVRSAVSSAGAIGTGQLMPGTAMDLQVNPMIPMENIKGMMTYIQQLSKRFSSQGEIAAAYLQGPAGAGLGSQAGRTYAWETNAQNPLAVPKNTAEMIQFWGNALGMPADLIMFGMKIAMQENKGQQGPVSIMSRFVDPIGGAAAAAAAAAGKPAETGGNKDVLAGIQQIKAYTAAIDALKEQQRQLDLARGNGVSEKEYLMRSKQIALEIARETDKMMELNRATQQNIAVSKVANEADATMLRNRQAMEDRRRNDPTITDAQAKDRLIQQEAELLIAYNQTDIELNKKIAADDKAAKAQAGGAAATMKQEAAQKALNDVSKSFVSDNPAFVQALAARTAKYLEAESGAQKINLEKEKVRNQETIAGIKTETEALHMQVDVGALYVQHKKDALAVEKEYAGLSPQIQANALKTRDAIAAMNQELSNQRAIGQYLAGQFDTMFSTIGTAITQAFVQGQGAAVNWGNVVKGVITQVQQAFIQLAIINPIKQLFLGSSIASAPTLSNVFGYLGGGGVGGGLSVNSATGEVTRDAAGTSGGGSILSLLSSGSSAVSGGNSLLQMLGFKGLGDQLGISNMFSGAGLFGSGGYVANLLATPFASVSGSATNAALAGLTQAGSAAQFGPATASQFTGAGGVIPGTIGGALGGFGAGFAAGSLAGTGVQQLTGKTGYGPEIGAAAGAALATAAVALAPATFGISLLAAGLLGGVVGGVGGGLIGPKAPSVFSSTGIGLDEAGRAVIGASVGQGVNTAAERKQALDDVMTLNSFLDTTGVKLMSLGDVAQLGRGTGADKAANVGAAFSQFRFAPSATDATLSAYLSGKSFTGLEEFETTIREYRALVDTALPALLKVGKTTGTLADSFAELNKVFEPAVGMANKYGVSITEIMKVHAEQEAKLRAAANKEISDFDTTLRIRKRVAEGGDPRAIELESFDKAAEDQRVAFKDKMVGIFGDAITQTEWFAPQMALLEETLGAERLAIVNKYVDQITQQDRALGQIHENFAIRLMNARGTGTAESRELFAFDINAARERISFSEQLTSIFGIAYKSTAAFGQEMARLEEVLGAERLAVIKKYTDALALADQQLFRANEDLNTRILNAKPGEAMAKELRAFDINARRETEDFTKNLLNTYGEAFATSKRYADEISLMEEAHGAERAAIVEKYFDAARKTATSAVTSLANYATGLSLSQASPLSQQDQLALARGQFNAVSGAAAAGDFNSLTQLQSYADSFLNASRAVYGSGEAYVTDFQRVLAALSAVSSTSSDTLTASVMQSETRTQTAELVQELGRLRDAVNTVTTQLRQNQTAPARIAA
jgi:hypothetical protein